MFDNGNHFTIFLSSLAMNTQILETFPNPKPGRDYEILIRAPEFTSVCPKTGHPDFGTIEVEYVPNDVCLELKSFKLYLHAFRNEGVFYERLVNTLCDDLENLLQPRRLKVTGDFTPRGGITTQVTACMTASKVR